MKKYLNIIRWPNVLMTILTQLVVVYGLLVPSGIQLGLADWQLFMLIASTALLTASGNIINDIYDVEIDQVNKPEKIIVGRHMSERHAFGLYIVFTSLAVVLGFVLANSLGKPVLASVFIVVAFLLYTYASSLKAMLLIGNILISLLVGLVVVITGVFELYPVISPETQGLFQFLLARLLEFAVLAFLINLIREWVKDCEDVNGDNKGGRTTIAIVLGRTRAAQWIAVFTFLVVILLAFFVYEFLYENQWATHYFIFLIIGPLLFVGIKLLSASQVRDFKILSVVLKVILLLGILSMGIFRIKYYL
ncbi:geranylgeranylglycerol-phosphate geranylgeranyltransferase [Nonlabens xiamenensis]|uniref:geranylgeranylglycerol-phosphate geranylgeranyltransferase n=1 Tax=Nonlabens xiamenensis TaxID=2341043 RepID=UPI000F6117CD|nr:geranylgeranylglycerol-phosphate geranylgeranyltransferase [Nonlabens xiamenensis]